VHSSGLVYRPSGGIGTDEDTATIGVHEPEQQLVAGKGRRDFQCKNRIQARLGKSWLYEKFHACITMISTRPIFGPGHSRTARSKSLQRKIRSPLRQVGNALWDPTAVVSAMKSPALQQVALQHFTAFRTLAQACWSAFMI